jgi:long-chain acyl-CoA synthetase
MSGGTGDGMETRAASASTANGAGTVIREADGKYVAVPGDLPAGTLIDLFFQAADEHDKPDAWLRRDDAGWHPVSHRDGLERVRHLVQALRDLGMERGDRVAILSENRLEWALTDYALLCAGALTVPVYPTLPADQVVAILEHSESRYVFVSSADQLQKVEEVRAQLPVLERVFTFDDVEGHAGESFSGLVEAGRARDAGETAFRVLAMQVQPEDLATIIYTSGTTGRPKGVMLTHANLYSNVVASFPRFPVAAADVALSFLTLSHVFQRMVDYGMYSCGTTIAHLPNIDDVAKAFTEVRPTIAVAVPRVYEKLYARILTATGLKLRLVLWARGVALEYAERVLSRRPVPGLLRLQHRLADGLVYRKVRDRLGGRIRFFISGGAPLNPQIAYFFHGCGVRILEGYGLTETSPVTNVNPPDAVRIGTVGPPIPGTEMRIAADGEILVRGPQVMKGYYRNADATAEVIDAEGWFHTGDIGDLDEDGYLRITDRKKDLLVTAGGKNIAPQPLENAAKTSRYISEAVMLGDRRPYAVMLVVPNFDQLRRWAEQQNVPTEPAALVADARTRELLEGEVTRRVEHFARFERPKKVVPLDRELTLERGEITPSLKVKRRVVEEHFRDVIEALYAEPSEA